MKQQEPCRSSVAPWRYLVLAAILCGAPQLGCNRSGSELAPVTGRVTLDGKPLAGARLRFQPEATGGSPSYGTADKDGRYELGYKRGMAGALLGWHVVRIEAGSTEGEGGANAPRALPARYNEQTELRREVKAGENQIDFELESGDD
jgi:hypothetical protein